MTEQTKTKSKPHALPERASDEGLKSHPSRGTTDPKVSRAFAIEVARTMSDDKCEDVVLLDVRELSHVTDYIVIASGTSERQMRSALKDVEDMGATRGFTAFRSSTDERATWLLADFVDVVAHVFEPNTRAHYDLEMLWGDAPRLTWERPEGKSKDRAGLRSKHPEGS